MQESLNLCEGILQRTPGDAAALHLSGLVLHAMGRSDVAISRLEQSIRIDPVPAEAWSNLALVYEARGHVDAAVGALHEAIRRDSRRAELWTNLAGLYLALARFDEAEHASRHATNLDARYAYAWFNLALSLQAQDRREEAFGSAATALRLAPDQLSAAGVKAQLEAELGRHQNSRETLDAAIVRHPTSGALCFQRAAVLEALGDLEAAARSCARAIELSPGDGAALSELIFLRKQIADWQDLAQLRRRFRDGVRAGQPHLTPFSFLSDPSTRAEQRRCAERWSALFQQPVPDKAQPRSIGPGRLRIGYLSSDFRQHATAILTAGLFEQHDRSQFEIFGYSTGRDDGSAIGDRVRSAFDHFVPAHGWPAERLAERIRADGIAILVDLKGHTENAATPVLARRPAPIQVNYLGYPGTMGAGYIDYIIGDPVVTPIEHASDYSETLVLLPHSYQVNDRQRPIAEPLSRDSLGLAEAGCVLCCFNSSYKINPEVLDAWRAILERVPRAVLWLLVRNDADPAARNLRREARARGIRESAVVFATHRPNVDYLALYANADLFLDTWPYNAHTTASDALWAGCPVLSIEGDTFASRVGASLLRAVELPELVVADVPAYIERAVTLAHDATERGRLRAVLTERRLECPLFDTARTTRALERAYQAMAEQFRSNRREVIRIDDDDPPPPV